jgi:hypothetical protein
MMLSTVVGMGLIYGKKFPTTTPIAGMGSFLPKEKARDG